MTKVYRIEAVFRTDKTGAYTTDTLKALADDGYTEMQNGAINCTTSFHHAKDNKYAVYVVNGDNTYLVLIDTINGYINFMRQISPCSHIFEHFVKNAS